MATATQVTPLQGAMIMSEARRLKPAELQELVKQVQALRAVTKMTGVFTSRRIGYLLENLCTEDMVDVGKALQLKARELPRKAETSVKRFDAQGKPEPTFNR